MVMSDMTWTRCTIARQNGTYQEQHKHHTCIEDFHVLIHAYERCPCQDMVGRNGKIGCLS